MAKSIKAILVTLDALSEDGEIIQISDSAYISLISGSIVATGFTNSSIEVNETSICVLFDSMEVTNFKIGQTPDGYFGEVLSNISLLNFTPTPTQIAQQYADPEHFLWYEKELQGDGSYLWVGYSDYLSQAEIDNVVAYLPMCEEGKYVSDLANRSEGVVNALVTSYTANTAGTNNTNTNIDNVFTIHNESDSTATYLPFCRLSNSNRVEGELYLNTIVVNITSGTAYLREVELDDTNHSIEETLPIGTYTYTFVGNFQDDTNITLKFNGQTEITFDAIVTMGTRKLTATYPIAEYTDACRTGATNLLKGLQTVGLKRDSLGVPYALADGIDLHGQVPALPIAMTDTELYENGEFSIEFVISRGSSLTSKYLLDVRGSNAGFYISVTNSSDEIVLRLYDGIGGSAVRYIVLADSNKHHIVFTVSPTHLTMYVNKVAGTPVAHSFVPSGLSFADSTQPAPEGSLPLFKTHYKPLSQTEVDKQYDKAILEGAFGDLLTDEQGNYLTDEDGNYIIIGD